MQVAPDEVVAETRRLLEDLVDQEESEAAADTLAVQQYGPDPGQKILLSPHRDEINDLLFKEVMPYTQVARICEERWGLLVSRKSIANYVKTIKKNPKFREKAGAPADNEVVQYKTDHEATQDLLRRIIRKGFQLLDHGQVDMKVALQAADLQHKMFERTGLAAAMAREERYRAALQVVMDAITRFTAPEQRLQIQTFLMNSPDFTAALDLEVASRAQAAQTDEELDAVAA